jgi:hypothetical protein
VSQKCEHPSGLGALWQIVRRPGEGVNGWFKSRRYLREPASPRQPSLREVTVPIIRIAAAVSLWLAVVPACGLLSSRGSDSGTSPAKSEISVEVESHNWSDIVIYLMNGNQSQRLGMVTGLSTIHFVLPFRKLATGGKVRLRAHPVGGPGPFTSEDLLVQPGQWIKWTLESDLSRSSLAVY